MTRQYIVVLLLEKHVVLVLFTFIEGNNKVIQNNSEGEKLQYLTNTIKEVTKFLRGGVLCLGSGV